MTPLVPRKTLVIADLHGTRNALNGNLKGADALNARGHWKHPGCDVVFLGDEMADRGEDDLEVIADIHRICQQVREAGGTATTIIGNHDMKGIRFLGSSAADLFTADEEYYRGITALASPVGFLHGCKNPNEVRSRREKRLKERGRDDFLGRFKMSGRGREVIRHCLGLQLYAVSGSTLFVHTPPTQEMLKKILEEGQGVNQAFGKGIARELRQKGASPLNAEEEAAYAKYEEVFLEPNNRRDSVPPPQDPIWTEVENRGIKAVFFGHDLDSQGAWPGHSAVQLFGVDTFYGRSVNETRCAAVWLHPDAKIEPCFYDFRTQKTP